MTCVLLVYLNQLQFLKHLHAALHLKGLRVGALESLDKVLCLGNHLLLLLILLHLLFASFLAQFQILAVCSLVVVNAAHGHLDGSGGDVVHKLAVVANYYHGL